MVLFPKFPNTARRSSERFWLKEPTAYWLGRRWEFENKTDGKPFNSTNMPSVGQVAQRLTTSCRDGVATTSIRALAAMPPDLLNVSTSSPVRGEGRPPFPNAYRSGGRSVSDFFAPLPPVVDWFGFKIIEILASKLSPNAHQAAFQLLVLHLGSILFTKLKRF